jgi:hypothetical protein
LTLYPIEKIPHLFVGAYWMGLQEARLLMLNENLDAASAAHLVGYNNAAHFNRKVSLSEQAKRAGAWVRLDETQSLRAENQTLCRCFAFCLRYPASISTHPGCCVR